MKPRYGGAMVEEATKKNRRSVVRVRYQEFYALIFCKINANFNAEICKIYAIFNAKYVRSTLNSTLNM